jgi:uncharacterized UPF0160 family protein
MNDTSTVRIATHSGSFHADDVFGVAVLTALHPRHDLIRSRNPDELAKADFLVDVGGVWDAAGGRFDHHQRGFDGARVRRDAAGAEIRAEGYASAGLVWKEFGVAFVRQVAASIGHTLDDQAAAVVASDVDSSLVRYLDLVDTGAAAVAPGVFGLSSQLSLLNTTWLEEQGHDAATVAALQLERFREAMALVQRLLHQLVLRRIGQELAAAKVRAAPRLLGGKVLHLQEGGMPWTRVVVDEMPEVVFVLYPETDADGQRYVMRTVPVAGESFTARKDLPKEWAGLRDAELAKASGVPDAIFCHTNLFIGVAKTFDGALRMAKLAL